MASIDPFRVLRVDEPFCPAAVLDALLLVVEALAGMIYLLIFNFAVY